MSERTTTSSVPLILALLLVGGIGIVAAVLVFVVRQSSEATVASARDPVPSASTSLSGQTFDRYRLHHVLGRGGMATVHLAVDTEREQQVALKLLDSSHFGDQDIVRKFLKEGEALQRIHEAQPDAPVVRAYRFGREHDSSDGRPYVALEYLQGDNLLTRLKKRGPLTSAEAVLILKQVCQGLRAAHACKIWHRDITPDNVIVLSEKPTPRVRLIDFGVAKHQYAKRGTMDGSIMGKPPYMSPEQCRNDHVDGHSDVYSAGMLFYTMVTGEPPFTDDNPLQVMQMHEQAQRPDLPSAVPAQVRRLIQQMIQTDASDRPDADRVVQVIEGLQVTI